MNYLLLYHSNLLEYIYFETLVEKYIYEVTYYYTSATITTTYNPYVSIYITT